jgi:hypothetical protein
MVVILTVGSVLTTSEVSANIVYRIKADSEAQVTLCRQLTLVTEVHTVHTGKEIGLLK